MTSPWSNHCWILVASRKATKQVAVLALFPSPRTVPNVSVYGPDHNQWLNVERCYLIFLHLVVVGVSSSVWWFKNGNWCLVFVPCSVGPG